MMRAHSHPCACMFFMWEFVCVCVFECIGLSGGSVCKGMHRAALSDATTTTTVTAAATSTQQCVSWSVRAQMLYMCRCV